MNKILLIIAATLISFSSMAQTQKTNRTNSRSHYPPDTTRKANSRMEDKTDADRNNPTNTTNPPANNSNSTPAMPTNSNTKNPNNPNIENNKR